ncbi:MAG: class I SAM-dependent methyltransferase [Candidatus Krumholzibacteriia bacterium]
MADRLYDDPSVYDVLQTPGTAREVDVIERVERGHGGRRHRRDDPTTWFEPACGTGRYLRVAARRGHPVLGCDSEPAMVAYAGRRLARALAAGSAAAEATDSPRTVTARLTVADMTDPQVVPRLGAASADLALNPVNSIRHLTSDRAVLDHLTVVARILRPGGIYVVGISLEEGNWLGPDEDVWVGRRGRCRVRQVVNYLPPRDGGRPRREVVLSHLVIERPRGVEHRDHRYVLRTYSRAQWRRLVARSSLHHEVSLDASGRVLAGRRVPYQLEVLRAR